MGGAYQVVCVSSEYIQENATSLALLSNLFMEKKYSLLEILF